MIKPIAVDVVGVIHRLGAHIGVDAETGAPVYAVTVRPGWHVNASWPVDTVLPAAWADARIDPEPATPTRRTAGLPDAMFFETFHRFADEVAFLAVIGADDGAA
ncbi:hypothetical protein EOD42_14240 [Rhodovarius crocodyli]|uniref:Uncharacterized protein n=1 Tax=Rhodovarius crocodyli TaxID=1979269 RepID=A0A437MF34_9PROT|nr:hypothetical protein [Rhodovarius crocodyli]RVT96268.1 hypothetical protein EOD42_14240 [Rhodovarius crocodyli]